MATLLTIGTDEERFASVRIEIEQTFSKEQIAFAYLRGAGDYYLQHGDLRIYIERKTPADLIASIEDGRLNQGIETMMRRCHDEKAWGVLLISGEWRWDELDHLCVADTINGVPVWRPTGWTTESVQGALFNVQRYGVLTYLDMGQHAHIGKALRRIVNKLPHFGDPTIHYTQFEAPFGYSTLQEKQMAWLATLPGIGSIRAVSLIDHLETWSSDTPFFNLVLMLANKWDPLPAGIGEGTCDNVRKFLGLREGEKLYALTSDPADWQDRIEEAGVRLCLKQTASEKQLEVIRQQAAQIRKLKKQGGKNGKSKKQATHRGGQSRSRKAAPQPTRRTHAVAKR